MLPIQELSPLYLYPYTTHNGLLYQLCESNTSED